MPIDQGVEAMRDTSAAGEGDSGASNATKPAAGALREAPRFWLRWLTGRREPTLYQRCLALHIARASRGDPLSAG